uniref:Tyrosyl-DNA phosphodiesterase 2 n=1 Tax=Anabas testudineus TaxID=64144 RepID=A0A3Q1I5F2_ANATE
MLLIMRQSSTLCYSLLKLPSCTEAEAASCSRDTVETKEKPLEQDDDKLSLITWNVDGLDGVQQARRARALCCYLTQYSPDVVFLQEIIQPFARFLHSCLAADYTIIEGGKEGYFTMMLLKKSSITLERSGIVAYPATHMMRNLLVARVLFKGQKFCLMTSHFESCKANAAERKRQLRLVMRRMSKAREDVTVLFGGDTNLRDAEVAEVGLPSDICDVWEQLGEPEHCRYTWDTEANTNREMRFKSRFRFDRVYLRPATMDRVPQLEPDSMALVGLEKLKCGRFTSDHWGVYCTFSAEWK